MDPFASGYNLPPGVFEWMLPGNRPGDELEECPVCHKELYANGEETDELIDPDTFPFCSRDCEDQHYADMEPDPDLLRDEWRDRMDDGY